MYKYTVYRQVHVESATPTTPTAPKKLIEFVQISRPTLAQVGWARAHPWLRQWSPDSQFGTHCLMICVILLCTISVGPEDVPVRLTFETLVH